MIYASNTKQPYDPLLPDFLKGSVILRNASAFTEKDFVVFNAFGFCRLVFDYLKHKNRVKIGYPKR